MRSLVPIPKVRNGVESSVIYNTELPFLIDVIWHTSTQDYCSIFINVQTQTIRFVNDPFVILKVLFTLNLVQP